MIFLLRDRVIFCVKTLRDFLCVKRFCDFLCEEVACFFCLKRFFSEKK